MSHHSPLILLLMGFATLQLLFWGAIIRSNDPQGFVHGLGDLSRLDEDQRKAISRYLGNVLFAMAALMAAYDAFFWFYGTNNLALIAVSTLLAAIIIAIVLSMKKRLSRLARPASGAKHGG